MAVSECQPFSGLTVSDCCGCSAEAKVDAGLAARATGGAVRGFSKAMALRRLHWRNSLLGELLYAVNVAKVRSQLCGAAV
jgi:hypothetical protein